MKFLVTGALGFIGSYFIKMVMRDPKYRDVTVVGVNRNSSQKNKARLAGVHDNRFQMYYADFAKDTLSEVFEGVTHVFHFGAKTFVDHSIRDPEPFIHSNIVGTYKLLEEARKSTTIEKFFQVSTDEVYGSILKGAYKEDARLNPTNPYAATKAAGDCLALSYYNTYGVPVVITRTENNYGPWQHPQKVFGVFVKKALAGEPLPVYGDGKHCRMWLHVEDHCRAILHLAELEGNGGEIYHVAGEEELQNIDLAKLILQLLNKPEDQIRLVPDRNIRPGHDRRYALNVDKLRATGWEPKYGILGGFFETVKWYKENQWWLK